MHLREEARKGLGSRVKGESREIGECGGWAQADFTLMNLSFHRKHDRKPLTV